jgi:polyisoprenoid-binding protein YceI
MATLWKRFLSLLGLTESSGKTNGQRKALVQRLNTLPKLSEWVIDSLHSAIEFRVMHMGLVEVRGRFRQWQTKFRGTSPDFADLAVEIEIDMTSIQTDTEARDAHLKSPEFFDVATYPKAFFKSTRIEWQPLRTFRLHGELTLRGVTHAITLQGELKSFVLKDMFGQPRVAFYVSAAIDRRAWGLTWQMELEGGELAIDNIVHIEAHVELATPQAMAAMQQMLASMGASN